MAEMRKYHYDILRILAAFSVVMLHSAAQCWYVLDIRSTQWIVANSYNAVSRFGVPIFVMISGALFLDEEYVLDIKHLYTRNIFRLSIIYILWNCLYGLYDSRYYNFREVDWKDIAREMLVGRYHLWFLPMLVGIYVLLPILKSWIAHTARNVVGYYLCLFFVLQVGRETLRACTVTDELHYILDVIEVPFVCGYVGYFVLGYYLYHIGIRPKVRMLIYVLAIPSLIANIVLGNTFSFRAGVPVGAIYDSFGIFTFIISIAIFLGITQIGSAKNVSEVKRKVIKEISASTFGVYLLHVGLLEYLMDKGIHCMVIEPLVGIPLYAVFIFGVCLIVSSLLRKIPYVGKYIC